MSKIPVTDIDEKSRITLRVVWAVLGLTFAGCGIAISVAVSLKGMSDTLSTQGVILTKLSDHMDAIDKEMVILQVAQAAQSKGKSHE